MNDDDDPKVRCPECGAIISVDESADDELMEWGLFSADCRECGEESSFLKPHRNCEWTVVGGRVFKPSK